MLQGFDDNGRKSPLTFEELRQAYNLTDWRIVLFDKRIPLKYGRNTSLNIFKVIVLPFLIEIMSEHALAREIAEREPLRALCGFIPGEKIPERGTFWNFRRKFVDTIPGVLIKALISMALSCKKINLDLPFVTPVSDLEKIPEGMPYEINLDDYQSPIEIWATPMNLKKRYEFNDGNWGKMKSVENFHEWEQLISALRVSTQNQELFSDLALPIEVKAKLSNGEFTRFVIDKPAWFLQPIPHYVDTVTTIGSSTSRPYFACHVVVIKKDGQRQQILLSKRMIGFGKGMYTLPGGKQKENETLQTCACRELFEETQMKLRSSCPISFHVTRYPGKPQVFSVGVLGLEYIGVPKTNEGNQHDKWEWFDLEKLPAPLFGPAKIVINHYLENKYSNLRWSDIESDERENKQLSFLD